MTNCDNRSPDRRLDAEGTYIDYVEYVIENVEDDALVQCNAPHTLASYRATLIYGPCPRNIIGRVLSVIKTFICKFN